MASNDTLASLRSRYLPDHVIGEILSKRWVDNAIPFSALVLTVVVLGSILPDFFSVSSLSDLARQFAEFGLVVLALAASLARPDRFLGLHFFNPVPVLNLVEIVPSLLTDGDVVERVRGFAQDDLGKHAIDSQDRAGFIVNALLIPFILSAIRMLESGFATAEDIDQGFVLGAAHPQGPLALADLIGLDTTMAVAQSLYEEFKEPLYAPPPLLQRMVDAGLLGRKTGRGFYDYAKKG